MRVDDRDRNGKDGREGKGVGRKRPLGEIRRGAVRLGGHTYNREKNASERARKRE